MESNYILIGMPGSGKTTVGKLLAQKTGYVYLDLDTIIEELEGVSISDIFANNGEEYFRNLETRVIHTLDSAGKIILSSGGGTFEREENRKILKSLGQVIYLYTEPDVLYRRIKNDTGRPLLQVENPSEELKNMFNKRDMNYRLADCIIDTTNIAPYNVVEEIIKATHGKNTCN